MISRHDACVSARRFRWHSAFEHVRCRCPTRGSGQNHFPQNRHGRLSSRVHIAATLTGTRLPRHLRRPSPNHAGGGLLLASRPGLLLKSASGVREIIEGRYRIVYRIRAKGIQVLTVFEGHRQFPTDDVGE